MTIPISQFTDRSTLGSKPNPVPPLHRLLRAFSFSWDGLKAAWADEWAFRVDVVVFVLGVPVGLWIGRTGLERAALIASLFLVLIAELVNTAIEAAVDRVGPDQHRLSKKAKDVGSAVVLLSLFNAVAVWLLILLPRLL